MDLPLSRGRVRAGKVGLASPPWREEDVTTSVKWISFRCKKGPREGSLSRPGLSLLDRTSGPPGMSDTEWPRWGDSCASNQGPCVAGAPLQFAGAAPDTPILSLARHALLWGATASFF